MSGLIDFYQILKVPSNAKQVDIDRAYQKMIKEARYDQTINRKQVETAYRTLSDATQRALYDATSAAKTKQAQVNQRIRERESRVDRRFQRLTIVFIVSLVIFIGYYTYRFGYYVKSFAPGDQLYFKDTGRYLGKIKEKDDQHGFGGDRRPAFLVITPDNQEIWYPSGDVKSLCEKR